MHRYQFSNRNEFAVDTNLIRNVFVFFKFLSTYSFVLVAFLFLVCVKTTTRWYWSAPLTPGCCFFFPPSLSTFHNSCQLVASVSSRRAIVTHLRALATSVAHFLQGRMNKGHFSDGDSSYST